MLNVKDQVIDKLQMPDVLTIKHPVIDVITHAVGIFGEKEPVIIGQFPVGKDFEHAQDRLCQLPGGEFPRLEVLSFNRHHIRPAGPVWFIAQVHVSGRLLLFPLKTIQTVADQFKIIRMIIQKIQPAFDLQELIGNCYRYPAQVLQGVILLGQIKKCL